MLTATNIGYTVGKKILLEDVSVTFAPQKLNLIIGPNGAGKSTLVKILTGSIRPHRGKVLLGEKNISEYSFRELARVRAVLSQQIELGFPFTVRQVVMMGRYPHFTGKHTQKDTAACEDVLDFFKIADMGDRMYSTLSSGEKQKVQFARILSQIWYPNDGGFRYLVLDEPLVFLDVRYQFDFMQNLSQLLHWQDLVIIAVVHDLNIAARFGDYVLVLNEGRTFAAGTQEEVLTTENIRAVYGLEPVLYRQDGQLHILF